MSKRITITLPDTVYAEAQQWAKERGQSVASAVAAAVEQRLDLIYRPLRGKQCISKLTPLIDATKKCV